MRLVGQVGSFSSVSLSQAAGSSPLSLAVPSRVWIDAARLPARSEPGEHKNPGEMGRPGKWRGPGEPSVASRCQAQNTCFPLGHGAFYTLA